MILWRDFRTWLRTREQASRLLANVKVQQAISEIMAERSKRTGEG